jgi:hypothetical protein
MDGKPVRILRYLQLDNPVEIPPLSEADRLAAFAANDRDRDGRLSVVEYMGVLETLGYTDQFRINWPQRDTNNDGFVSAEEYRLPLNAAVTSQLAGRGPAPRAEATQARPAPAPQARGRGAQAARAAPAPTVEATPGSSDLRPSYAAPQAPMPETIEP